MKKAMLTRPYDSIDMLALKALLSYEGCLEALELSADGWIINAKKGRNLLYREKGSLSWIHSLTVPLWREIVSEVGEEWSEDALRYVAKLLISKCVLIEADMPKLLEGAALHSFECGNVAEGFRVSKLMI